MQAGLVTQYGTAGWNWVPSMAWPDRIGDGLGIQFGTVGHVTISTGSVATSPPRTEPGTPARHSQWSHNCVGTRVTRGCHILRPGCSQRCHVPGSGCPQGCHIPSRMGLSPRVSHPSTRGILRDVPSQGKRVPGVSHPRTGFSQECHTPYWDVTRNIHPAGTGLSGWGPWRW